MRYEDKSAVRPLLLAIPLLAIPLLAIAGTAAAQPVPVPGTGYAIERVPQTYASCPGTLDILSMGDGGGVKGEFDVNLPFAFTHYDTSYNSVTVMGAGTLAFPAGQAVSITNTVPGTAAAPNALVAVFWEDIELLSSNNGYLATSVTGTAPNRQFCIEWNNFNDEQVNSALVNYKVILHEGPSGQIDVVYGPTSGGTGSYTATMGIEDATGARPVEFRNPACSPNCGHTDLVAMNDTRVTVTRDAGPELAPIAVSPPEFAFLDAPFDLRVQIGNFHSNAIGPFEVEVFAADNPMMNNAVSVGTGTVFTAGFQVLDTLVEVVPPQSLGQGRAYFELVVDSTDVVAEVSEGNNRLVSSDTTRLLPPGADLSVESVRVSSTTLPAGSTFEVVTELRNRGALTVNGGRVAVVLSTNPAISRQDHALASFTVDLTAGATQTTTVAVTMPTEINPGTYYVGVLADPNQQLDELDEINNGLADFRTVRVTGGGLTVRTTEIPTARILQPYEAVLIAGGGTPPFSWRVSAGQLPMGVGLATTTGELFGRPPMEATETFTVEVMDADGDTATAELTLRVVDPTVPLTIVTREVPEAVVGQEYVFPIVITGRGSSSPDLMWTTGGLPPGFMLTASGVLAGTADAAQTSTVTITVASDTETASRDIVLVSIDSSRLRAIPAVLPPARFGEAYSTQIEALGGVPPYTWLVESGSLPEGIDLAPSGTLSGEPRIAGEFRVVFQVRDAAAAPAGRDTEAYVLQVLDTEGFSIATDALPVGAIGAGYQASIEAAGGLAPYRWEIVKGTVPEGIVAESDDRSGELRFAGQVRLATTVSLLVQVTDAQRRRARKAFVLHFEEPVVVVDEPDEGCGCTTATDATPAGWVLLLGVVLFVARRRGRVT